MDWIEKLFGISPDGGDGSTEMLIVMAVAAVAVLAIAGMPSLRAHALRTWRRRP